MSLLVLIHCARPEKVPRGGCGWAGNELFPGCFVRPHPVISLLSLWFPEEPGLMIYVCFSFFFPLFIEIKCVCMLVFAYLHVHACLYAHRMYAVPVEVRRGCRIHWSRVSGSESQLGTELTFSVNATSLLS